MARKVLTVFKLSRWGPIQERVKYVQDAIALAIGILQFALVVFMLRGPIRRYGFVLFYCLVQLGTSVGEIWVANAFGARSRVYWHMFWIDEIGLDLFLFLILIVLSLRALHGHPLRPKAKRVLFGVALAAMTLPFVLFKGAFRTGAWYDHTSQLLNFGAAMLNLTLWSAIIATRQKDRQLPGTSSGFGIMATGVAISYGLRRLGHGPGFVMTAGNTIFQLAHLAGAFVLCWAFRPRKKKEPSEAAPCLSQPTIG